MEKTIHVPVLLREAIDFLEVRPGMTVVDATLGGGGYTRALVNSVGDDGRVIACDADLHAIERFKENYPQDARKVIFIHSNYTSLKEELVEKGIKSVDAIVADLGLSSDQLNQADRGFTFLSAGPIDMRLDVSRGRTAGELIESSSEEDLRDILRHYGDERHASRIARAIKESWPCETTEELSQVIVGSVGRFYRGQKIHPATRTFQALRIAVNDEYQNLETFVSEGLDMLVGGGRMSIVTFHSGEDRIVKNVFRSNARGCICPSEIPICQCEHVATIRRITRKPTLPSDAEVHLNVRSRSAKLRVAEKVEGV